MYDESILNGIKDALIEKGETIAVAESVTSGHLQAALSSAENASMFYQGGITAYNLGQKARHLNIDPIKADSCNSVAQEIAILMATEVCRLFTCDWGMGITGYAAPLPEQHIEQPFAYFAIVQKGKAVVSRKVFAQQASTTEVQLFFVDTVMHALHDAVGVEHPATEASVIKPAIPVP